MKRALFILTFLTFVIIQTTWVDIISVCGVVPDFLFVFVILYAIHSTPIKAGIVGGICGLIYDVSGTNVFGFNTLLMIYVSVGAFIISGKLYCDNVFVSSGVVLALSFILELFKVTVFSLIYQHLSFWDLLFRFTFLECFLNTLLAFVMFKWVKWLSIEYIKGL